MRILLINPNPLYLFLNPNTLYLRANYYFYTHGDGDKQKKKINKTI